MPTGGPLPYLAFSDVEVANAARTLAYLRRGLADTVQGRWELGPGDLCGVLNRLGGGSCAHPEVFIHPAVDPAPWYDPTEPGSSTFLGFNLLDIQGYDSTITRSATQRLAGLGGGTLSAQYRTPRVWKFRGAMISADDAGAEYGLRWLTSVLQTPACDICTTGFVTVRLTCPPADCSDDSQGEWLSYEAALTDGPHEVEPFGPFAVSDSLAGCRDWVTVEFTITAGNPFLYKRPRVCLPTESLTSCTDDTLAAVPAVARILGFASDTRQRRRTLTAAAAPLAGIAAAGGFKRTTREYGRASRSGFAVRTPNLQTPCENICDFLSGAVSAPCCQVEPPLRGVLGGIFTVSSDTGFGEIELVSRTNCEDTVPLLKFRLASIPAGTTVVVNSANHTVTVTDNATGESTDGQYLIALDPGETIEWIEIANCESAVCICVNPVGGTPGHTATVKVETQLREG